MVEVPAVVEPGIVGDPPDFTQLVDRRGLRSELQPNANLGHDETTTDRPWFHHQPPRPTFAGVARKQAKAASPPSARR
jgi:hypothetical protein